MTSVPSISDPSLPVEASAARAGWLGTLGELTKFRLSALVLVTTAVGFLLATTADINWVAFAATILGTALSAGCANALNQVFEIARDARMHRTRFRPLPTQRMPASAAALLAVAMGVFGITLLAAFANMLAAALALLTILLYVFVYTPLKPRTTLNTLVGAVCGAIPPMIGWVAVTGSIDAGAWALGGILFVWQFPHFFALAWLYREDYARGGFAMLPVVDGRGEITFRVILIMSLLLLPLGLLLTLLNLAGGLYALGSIVLGIWAATLALRLYRCRTDAGARGVFLASITYLPLLLCLAVMDRGPIGRTGSIANAEQPALLIVEHADPPLRRTQHPAPSDRPRLNAESELPCTNASRAEA